MFVKELFGFALFALVSVCQSNDAVKRIKGGSEIQRGDFSLTAQIQIEGSGVCTGLLVDRKWLLTLKSCIDEGNLGQYTIQFKSEEGDTDVTRTLKSTKDIDSNDYRLIIARLNKKIRRKIDYVRPLDRFISRKKEKKMTSCKAVGYSSVENDLSQVDIKIQPGKACKSSEKESTFCFDTVKGKVCEVDNGSPILCKLDNKWHLAGFSSVAEGCEDDNISGIRLSYYRKSIARAISEQEENEPEENIVCVENPLDCLSSLNSNEIDECIVCAEGCDGSLKSMSSTVVEVLNPAVCSQEAAGYSNFCNIICKAKPECGFVSSDFSQCIFYGKECVLRATLGGTLNQLYFYSEC